METYKTYRKKLSYSEYFSLWEEVKIEALTEGLMKEIHAKYIVKCDVFQRDNFKCQNLNCITPDSSLTMHHIKWKKNGGKDSLRNCITLCDRCHKKYHRAKLELKLSDNDSLPAHMRGMTYLAHKDESIDWKIIKKQNKQLRKSLRHEFKSANWDIISVLIKWLEM